MHGPVISCRPSIRESLKRSGSRAVSLPYHGIDIACLNIHDASHVPVSMTYASDAISLSHKSHTWVLHVPREKQAEMDLFKCGEIKEWSHLVVAFIQVCLTHDKCNFN